MECCNISYGMTHKTHRTEKLFFLEYYHLEDEAYICVIPLVF